MTGNTTCKFNKGFQHFNGEPQIISVGGISENVTVVNVTTEQTLITTPIPAGLLNSTEIQFETKITGTISSDGTDDCTFTLRYGTTDILEVTTVSLPDEDDKAFSLTFQGRVHTTGATGKVVATGTFKTEATGIADIIKSTAVAGVTVDLTAEGSINITTDWDTSSADSENAVFFGATHFFN